MELWGLRGYRTLVLPSFAVVVNHKVKPKPLTCCGYASDFALGRKKKKSKKGELRQVIPFVRLY